MVKLKKLVLQQWEGYNHYFNNYPSTLFANLKNIYIILLIVTLVWMGIIGFVDDYIKLYKKIKTVKR